MLGYSALRATVQIRLGCHSASHACIAAGILLFTYLFSIFAQPFALETKVQGQTKATDRVNGAKKGVSK